MALQKYTCQPLRRDSLLYVVVHFEACWTSDRDGFGRLRKALVLDILGHDALSPTGGEGVVFRVSRAVGAVLLMTLT